MWLFCFERLLYFCFVYLVACGEWFSMLFLYSSYIRRIFILYRSYINPLGLVVFIVLFRGLFIRFALERVCFGLG